MSSSPKTDTPIDVAVGILIQPNGDVLLGQRPAGKPYPGYWEFPGGKVENAESILAALKREFYEELGIDILSAEPWCCIEHVYPHAHVRLHFYISHDWRGEPKSLEGQAFTWQGKLCVEPLLPATVPLIEWLDKLRYQQMTSPAHAVAIIGGGPAGLMAAEVLQQAGVQVDLYDAMPSVGRKFLLAGKGGMNLTHAEPFDLFLSRYGTRQAQMAPMLRAFGPAELREWCRGLGIDTFVGSSGRVFPNEMKAAPLLRAWLHRLRAAGVRFHMRHLWTGWEDDKTLHFLTPTGDVTVQADATLLALGGGSWARLGSDGAWVSLLSARGVNITPLKPANCGFDCHWSEHLRSRFAGQPLKSVAVTFTDQAGITHRRQGELMITEHGLEGSLIYALSAPLRDAIDVHGSAVLHIDLVPGHDLPRVIAEVSHPRGSRSMSSHLQSRLNLRGAKSALLRELVTKDDFSQPLRLANAIKSLPLRLVATRPIDEAISSAGGVLFESLDERLMVRALPGLFCAGEMLDWEAPTGGYLLTACFASGRAAGFGVLDWLKARYT